MKTQEKARVTYGFLAESVQWPVLLNNAYLMCKWTHLPALTGNLIQLSSSHAFHAIKVIWAPSVCPGHLRGAPTRVSSLQLSTLFLHPLLSSMTMWGMTDGSQSRRKKPFSSRWVKKTLTSIVFKLSHKSAAFRQIEQNGTFQAPQWSSMSDQGIKGAPARESLNDCIILSVAAQSKGPFHTYRHLLLAFL